MAHWTTADIPPQHARSAVVTGTGGLGLEVALALARAGAAVVIAGRNPDKGKVAVAEVRAAAPEADVDFEQVDLADLSSVAAFARRLSSRMGSLDLLINNAGVMRPPRRMETRDGFELQLGINYLSHFALTGQLLPLLRTGSSARVVTLSSVAARGAAINFDDLNAKRSYAPMSVYGQSKLACLMFALELQRRSTHAGWGFASMAAHPGLSKTSLLENAPGGGGRVPPVYRMLRSLLMQPAAQGALPILYAATAAQAEGGDYYGPNGPGETRGYPATARAPGPATDTTAASRLWNVSQELTGVRFG